MAKTALDLKPEELALYRPLKAKTLAEASEKQERARLVAQSAANLLKTNFGATRVILFGSVAHHEWFHPHSDIDISVSGVAPEQFYKAVAVVTGLSPEFEIDLVDFDTCPPSLRQSIQQEGIDL